MPGTWSRASPALAAALDGLSNDAVERLAGTAVRREISRGSFLFRTGDRATNLFVVTAGSFKLSSLDPDGHETLLELASPGAILGELAAGTQDLDARAGEPSVVLAIPRTAFAEHLGHRMAAEFLLELACRRTWALTSGLCRLTRVDTRRRIAARICDLASHHGQRVVGGRRIGVALTQEDLGRLSGTSRETANKAVAHLIRRGWLARHGGRYIVTDEAALRNFAFGYPSSESGSDPSQSQT